MLACTHYPLLLERMRKLAPWPVDWIDPAPAIARRVVDLIGPRDAATAGSVAFSATPRANAPSPSLARALAGFGFSAATQNA